MYLKILFSLFFLFFLNACTNPTADSDGSSGGSGYQVTCKDGTISHSGGKQGACSHHGGVREYNTNTLPATNYYPYVPTTSNTFNATQTLTLGTYKGTTNIKIQEQYSSDYTYLPTTCTLSIPISINTYERESNPFNLKCTTDDNTSAYSFSIISASIVINPQIYGEYLYQYWNIKQINESFEGTLVDKHYSSVVNFFRGKNNKIAIYYFKNGTKLSAIYNKNNDSLIIYLRGEGDTSSYPSTTATCQATMNLTKVK